MCMLLHQLTAIGISIGFTFGLFDKSGCLLAITAIAHQVCLFPELVHAYTLTKYHFISRVLRFNLIFPQLNAHISDPSFVMMVDLLFTMVFLMKYHSDSTKNYLGSLLLLPFVYTISFQYPAVLNLIDDDTYLQYSICTHFSCSFRGKIYP
ncbi:unnamed protein product [Auanema sp. JU1783]|nr:unnamed protein product [Auanema sp. JU1783]